jgi:PTH1 family peptidyl-tRNA hydrolase
MKVVVGLGNPGKTYENTRHNVGFSVIACLASRWQAARPSAKFQAEIAEIRLENEKTLLVCPLTFMNLSGRSVGQLVAFYRVPLEDLLIICDDLSLPLGKIRLRGQGSSGGQKGLQDVIATLGSSAFPRLRIGIDATPAGWDTADYVLSKFSSDEAPVVAATVERAADVVEMWAKSGLTEAMNKYNRQNGQ